MYHGIGDFSTGRCLHLSLLHFPADCLLAMPGIECSTCGDQVFRTVSDL